jgi:hypothetical protein
MTTLMRSLVYLGLLLLLGIGIRLMYYGLQTVVGSSPHYDLLNVLWMLVGIVLFVSGIITGILFLSPRSPTHN